jgi:hypothetical protein
MAAVALVDSRVEMTQDLFDDGRVFDEADDA